MAPATIPPKITSAAAITPKTRLIIITNLHNPTSALTPESVLREVGVDTVKELRYRNPARLATAMAEANKKRKLVRFLPSEKLVTRWVEHARKLPQKITYR